MAYDESAVARLEDTFVNLSLTSRLRDNRGSETAVDQQAISDLTLQARVADLDISAKILQLQEQQGRLRGYSSQCRSLKSPIRRLPDDVLRKIFLSLRDDGHPYACATSISVRLPLFEVPGLRAHAVCRHWRTVAHSTPALWSHVAFDLDFFGHADEDEEKLAKGLSIILSRAKSCPLRVTMTLDADIPFSSPRLFPTPQLNGRCWS